MRKVDKGTIIRTSVLLLALINTSLQLMGWEVLPFTEDQLEMFITVALNFSAAMLAWWKNNSFTPEAIEADKYMKNMKSKRK